MVNENDMKLIKAADEGNTEQVKALIEEGYNVNTEDRNGNTLVHWAAYTDNVDLLKFLKEKGADLKAVNHFGEQAIHAAAKANKVQAAAYLKEQGADVNAQDKSRERPIHEAARKGHVEMIQWLCENGAELNVGVEGHPYGYGCGLPMPVHLVAENGNIAAMDVLVKHGADVNISSNDRYNYPPAYYAAIEGHLDMLKWLKKHGADMKAVVEDDQESLLHIANIEKDDWKMVDFLVNECGLSVNGRDEKGRTPLMDKALRGHYDMAKKLIGLGADVHTVNHRGESALFYAGNHNKLVELLLKNGCDPNASNKNGWTPAHYAALKDDESTLKLLWRYGADLDQRIGGGMLSSGHTVKDLYEFQHHKELPIDEWREEARKEEEAAAEEPEITANTPSNGNATNVLKGIGQDISKEVAEVAPLDTSRSV